ncbi:hypothetical protein FHU41_000630 [Psychromicrobium silvestre]|uniref:DUF3054 domain-containing protein n=1 Tax=Psychromicrobium silvestre TaxID=1645614 RepID=A0A7Y9LRT4_9MICC|nr:DUF3054 domain-containing protein [Psychromicrobium silvestre]NYE94409.1 hypothetical protein [Psychromicrobium silvestre]
MDAETVNKSVTVRPGAGAVLYALLADAVLILVFAAIGRASHQEGDPVLGVLQTAWPFLAGAALGWLAGRVWRAPLRLWPHGICLWLITVVAGMLLRVSTGKTAELSFVLVATVVLGLFLLGHRAIAGYLLRRRKA